MLSAVVICNHAPLLCAGHRILLVIQHVSLGIVARAGTGVQVGRADFDLEHTRACHRRDTGLIIIAIVPIVVEIVAVIAARDEAFHFAGQPFARRGPVGVYLDLIPTTRPGVTSVLASEVMR